MGCSHHSFPKTAASGAPGLRGSEVWIAAVCIQFYGNTTPNFWEAKSEWSNFDLGVYSWSKQLLVNQQEELLFLL